MDYETQLALKILNEDISLHRLRLQKPEHTSLKYLRFLANDIWNKEDMMRDMQLANPSKAALAEHIHRIDTQYIPSHNTKEKTTHDETWIKNYRFLKDMLRQRIGNSTNP